MSDDDVINQIKSWRGNFLYGLNETESPGCFILLLKKERQFENFDGKNFQLRSK